MNSFSAIAVNVALSMSIVTEAGQDWQQLCTLPTADLPRAAVTKGFPSTTKECALRARQAHFEVRWEALGGAVLSLSTLQPGGLGQLELDVLAADDLPRLQAHIHRTLGELHEILEAASAVEFSVLSVEEYEWDANAGGGYRVSLTQKIGPWPYRDSELFLDGAGYILSLHLGYLDLACREAGPQLNGL